MFSEDHISIRKTIISKLVELTNLVNKKNISYIIDKGWEIIPNLFSIYSSLKSGFGPGGTGYSSVKQPKQ